MTPENARPQQGTFDEVVELEPVKGDPTYNAWLAAGRPPVR